MQITTFARIPFFTGILTLAACATQLPDASPDHPANPKAAQAKPTARSTTLDYAPGQSSAAGSTESGIKMDGMEHGKDAHAGHDMSPGNQKPPPPNHEGHEAPTGEPSADYFYTCSMDPEVIQPTPGKCPVCGMKLTKKLKTKGAKP